MAKISNFRLADKVRDTLRIKLPENSDNRLSALKLAECIVENAKYRDACQDKLNKSKNHELRSKNLDSVKNKLTDQVRKEILARMGEIIKKYPEIKVDNTIKPRVFFYDGKVEVESSSDVADLKTADLKISEVKEDDKKILEKEFYESLQNFLYYSSGYRVYSRFIQHTGNKGQVSGKNRWLFPDLVGVQDLSEGWEEPVRKCVSEGNHDRIKCWSIEVKRQITESNLRESFFETVSNSSWANFAYLAAPEIQQQSEDVEKELRMLCNIHGIGFIVIDKEDFSEGYIKISAIEKKEVDWSTINRLAKFSENFKKNYVDIIRKFYRDKEEGKFSRKNWKIEILDDD